jgi:HD-like signal output (HDOD) protein
MPAIAEFFQNIKLPTMPEVAHSLIQTLHDDDIPFEKVRHAISKDPSLTAKLIRMANSARFGLSRQVASLDDAINMVGLNQVRTLALAACMTGSFADAPGIDRGEFWKESMACAGYAQWLARSLGTDVQQSWLTGFMVRLGELIIAQKAPREIVEIERLPHLPGGRWEREQSLLGFTEGEITAELAREWKFPEEVVRALATASDPLAHPPFCRLGGIVHIATLLAEIALEGQATTAATVETLPKDVLRALQLDAGWLEDHLPDPQSFIDTSAL